MPAASRERGPCPRRKQRSCWAGRQPAWTAGGPEQVRGLERGYPFSQRRLEIPVCPPAGKTPCSALAKATHPRGSLESSPSTSGLSALPHPGHREQKGEAGLASGESRGRGRARARDPRLPGGKEGPPTRRGGPGIRGQDLGRRQQKQQEQREPEQRTPPCRVREVRSEPGVRGSTRRQRGFPGASG